MGIQGLLPPLKSIQNPVSLRRYEGQTLGIDGYAWLHKAAYSCAYELVMGEPTEKYLNYFIKRFALLKTFNIQPYLIFDGDGVPVKKGTETKRKEKRIENREIAERLWKSGEKKNAMDFFQKCVDITPSMAKCVIDYCNTNHIKYIVAPFEADPQMVYLEQKGLIHGIISEDSDLLVFGCRRLITKLNDFGECIEICRDDFNKLPMKFPLGQLNDDQIRIMVCLSGCDYTDGIPKIGLVTAMKLVNRMKNMKRILLHIQREGKLKIPKDFLIEYEKACYGFQYQRVFCPINRKIVSLHDIPEHLASSPDHRDMISSCIGCVIEKDTHEKKVIFEDGSIDHHIHLKQALGELDPYDYTKRLISREKVLQLTSKSELSLNVENNSSNSQNIVTKKRGLQRKSIDSFFKPSNSSIGTNTSKLNSVTVSGFTLGASAIPTFVDKQIETVRKRKLTANHYEDIQLSSNVTLTSKFFGSRKTNVVVNSQPFIAQKLPGSNAQLNSSQISTTIEDSTPFETPNTDDDYDNTESQKSTDIPSSFCTRNGDSAGMKLQEEKSNKSSDLTPIENVGNVLKIVHTDDSGCFDTGRTGRESSKNVATDEQLLRATTRSSPDLASSQCETEVGESLKSDTIEDTDERNVSTNHAPGFQIYDQNLSNAYTASKISSLQSFRYSGICNEKTITTYPLQSRDINNKNFSNRTLKSGIDGSKQRKYIIGKRPVTNNQNSSHISLVSLRRQKTYNGQPTSDKEIDSQVDHNSHCSNEFVRYSQSSIHIRIKKKSGTIDNALESETPLHRSTSLLSQFKYKGK
ncbi:Rad2 nuclease [Maudiozyma exigua]|uniref:Rad2 nuclease n=1 Tax=Maudiozyma exigua TaxID=34358 RepID=A0A9P6WAC2_MAUEX|nr:Rad2 nuclease [Kazachstania exigua]